MIRIYNFARGARGLRVMWLCEEMGLPYQAEVLPFPTPADYRAKHPLGTVPFLEDDGGVAISESVAMLLYIAQHYGPTPLLPTGDPAVHARVLQLTVLSEASIGGVANPLMEAHFGAPEADKRNWSVRTMESRVDGALGLVAGKLGEGPFLAGEAFTIADIALVTTFGMLRGALGKELPASLAAYQERLTARPAYERAREHANGPAPG